MYEQRLAEVMDRDRLARVTPATTVREAAQLMAERAIGAALVLEGDRLVGIFTERDAVFRVIARGIPTETTPVSQVMTRAPKTLGPEARFGTALALMHKHGFRHVPVVDAGRVVGIVMARQALDPDMEEFVVEARRREHFQHD
jgi:CBS domain-containing protein